MGRLKKAGAGRSGLHRTVSAASDFPGRRGEPGYFLLCCGKFFARPGKIRPGSLRQSEKR